MTTVVRGMTTEAPLTTTLGNKLKTDINTKLEPLYFTW